MKIFRLAVITGHLSLITMLPSCAYNQITVTADNGSKVYCTGAVDKPVDVSTLTNPAIQANAPFQGGQVTDPAQNNGK